MSNKIGRVALAVLVWSALGIVFALPELSADGGWRKPLLFSLAQWWSWGLLTPLILAADRRLPFSDKQLPRRIVAHLLASVLFTLAYVYVHAAVRALVGRINGEPGRSSTLPLRLVVRGSTGKPQTAPMSADSHRTGSR